ncbi:MAG: hypothetical protein OEV55_08185 [candidate division Zixibacteria bacterium]|nr:hypothetical protein [candidate division Zixibacteria bacterium]
MKRKTFFVLGIVFVSLALILLLSGCKKKSTTPTPEPDNQQVLKTFGASPSSIQVGDTSFLSAEVTVQNDDPLASVQVNFSASPSSKGSFGSSSANTDSSGIASTYFVSSDTGNVTLRAYLSNGSDLTADLQISTTAVSTDSIASIELISVNPSIQVKGTGGIESVVLVATGYDKFGNVVGAGNEIVFRILNGPNGGENLENKGYGPDTALTCEAGNASVTLNSGTVSGTVEIRAEVGLIRSRVTKVAIHAGPPVYLSLGAGELNILGWNYVNCSTPITAMVDDVYGNPVQDNTAVYFGTEEGMVDAYDLTSGGFATSEYHSGEPRNDGQAYVWASTSGGTVADTIKIIISGEPFSVAFLTYPTSIIADGLSKGNVTVEVLDINGNYVIGGTSVVMESDFGTCPSGATQDGIYASIFDTKLTSEVLDKDYSAVTPDDGIGAVSYLTAKSGGVKDAVQVSFLTDLAYQKNCNLDIEGTVVYEGQAAINVEIKDRYGNPLGGHILTASATQGTITNSPDTTNAFGESWKMVFNAPPADTSIKSSTITITDQDPRGSWIILNKKVTLSATLKKK